jgi:hypothetical protein
MSEYFAENHRSGYIPTTELSPIAIPEGISRTKHTYWCPSQRNQEVAVN